jgi:hypothetical protein
MRVEVANLAIGQVVMGEFELVYRLEGAVNGGLEMIDKRGLPEARRGEVTECTEGRQLARSGLGQDPDRWRQRKVLATAKMLATLPQRQNRRRAEHTSLCARIP